MKKAEATRLNILQKSYELIYAKGYQATSIDDILATTQVTKGAFYYHFKNKNEMGIAIINEILNPSTIKNNILLDSPDGNPLESIYNMMYELLMENKFMKVEYGCPISNFVQEMTPWNESFRKSILKQMKEWENQMITSIENGKKNNFINPNINAKQVTFFIISGYWGIRNFGKLENNKSVYMNYLNELKNYLNLLK
ncbi:TetR/AcrR family transcriptional regulator [Flavobacterium sp. F-65]|uniref:TetR/AcrR family transcriptional regulator n=1 Tax=Flavobacterium pisciphilum TaxID=2893755 RepID=A0ABS8MZM8_9FLAO|nr:TetR/AcrR family transcriptional regulator [Flavobacterium sp. F-65]MCC9074224.1 TetR/AcrR family transcriptional regulator [Flavobacterium sp. F-65]